MKKTILILSLLLTFCSLCAVASANSSRPTDSARIAPAGYQAAVHPKLAVLSYINTSEEKTGYVADAVNSGYTNYFQKLDYTILPSKDAQDALAKTGYSTENEALPDKDQLAAVARATGADFVIAMEISELHASRHISVFQEKVTAKCKLNYAIYSVQTDKVYSFKATGNDDNKTVFGGVGYKTPIVKSLNAAMDKANSNIREFLAGNAKQGSRK